MVFAKLLHNPGAGEGEHSKKKLVSKIESGGFNCSYSSTKDIKWEKLSSDKIDFVALAGGDGTIRKVAEQLLSRPVLDKRYPIALLPLGTANNIAQTLGITGSEEDIIANWKNEKVKKYDVGKLYKLKKSKFFLEGFGFGVFPQLIKEMRQRGERVGSREEALTTALQLLKNIIRNQKASFYKITADNNTYSGNFIMVEVMNTQSIGPNLNLAPTADPGDGIFDIVMIEDKQRSALEAFIDNRIINGKNEPGFFNRVKAKKIEIFSEEIQYHADDQFVELSKPQVVKIELLEGALDFVV